MRNHKNGLTLGSHGGAHRDWRHDGARVTERPASLPSGVQVGHCALSRRASRAICVHLLHVAMTTDPFITDHLFVPLGITVKQLSALPFQVVQ